MNYQTWSKKKFWLVLAGTLFIGMLIAPKGTTKETIKEVPVEKIVTKEVVKEVPVEKIVTKEVAAVCDYSNWKQLKTIDDQAFDLATQDLGYCAQGFTAISNGDMETLQSITPKITAVTPQISELGTQRQAVLKQLGY